MTPDVVVDIGNTRVKWGRVGTQRLVPAEIASLPPDDPAAWDAQAERWQLPAGSKWVAAGVHPARLERLAAWIRERGDELSVIDSARQLPLRILLDEPDKVGIDRLLSAVAANYMHTCTGAGRGPVVVVGAGTAVTVDLIDESGAFRGGAILPGFHMMARALHDGTALLPLIDPFAGSVIPQAPGTSTTAAMRAGVFWAVAGGVRALVEQYCPGAEQPPDIFITGGDGYSLFTAVGGSWSPGLALLGLALAAEALP
jgi:type III pantothenate kinase